MAELRLQLDEALAVVWDGEPPRNGERPWRLEGDPAAAVGALRVLAANDGERSLLVAAARPDGADGHDAEQPLAVVSDAEGEREMDEVLLSTEYDAAGVPRRVGLEMYPEPDGYPVRAAGDAIEHRQEHSGGWQREIAKLDFRYAGTQGSATYEVWHRA